MYSLSLMSVLVGLLLLLCVACNAKRTWDYEPLSIETSSSDSSKMSFTAQTEFVRRGEYALTMTLDFNYQMDETTMIEVVGYRSASGSEEDYALVPWTIPKQTFKEFTETYYEDLVMKNFGKCSDLPKFADTDPWPQKKFKMQKCVATGDGMPDIAPEGYYKIVYTVTGEVDWGFVAIFKVTSKSNMMGY